MQEGRGARPVALFAIAGAILALDQATKALALATLQEGTTTPVIEGVLHWTLQRNPGAAFGLFRSFPVVFTVLAVLVSVGIVVMSRRIRGGMLTVAYGLVLGGALGNLVDRLVRPPGFLRGHVIDFIDLRVWPTFNVADSGIVVGAILIALASMREPREKAPEP